ncbi:hypothetical protein B5P22_24330 [Pseudomonas tolaasii]|nr:hypothetical protein B5P22_24330 [Pseudomonas tolaasii]
MNAIYRAQLIFKQINLSASKRPMNMGKTIGEGYKKDGYEYEKTKKARVILNQDGQPITAYGDF